MDLLELKQNQATIHERMKVGPVSSNDTHCPISIDGREMLLNETTRRNLAAYLIGGLVDHSGCPGCVVGHIITTAEHGQAEPNTVKRFFMELPLLKG